MVYIFGLSAFYHDSAACLVHDGEIIAAAQEERFTRKKHDESFPKNAVEFCLDFAGIKSTDLDHVAFYDKPLLTFERLLETYIDYAPRGFRSFIKAMPVWLTDKLWTRESIARQTGFEGKVLFTEHHESHAASAFYPSPFESAAILTMDGVGEWATSSLGVGRGKDIDLIKELRFPHSIGLLYSAFTYFTGFKVNSGEYKLMGLAPYGEPVYVDKILDRLVDVRDDGSLRLDMSYFDFASGLRMTNRKFADLFGGPARTSESEITQREMDLARSVQEVTEMVMLRMANHAYQETGEKNLCLAGGVALNCVGNGRILRETPFENIWIQPAAGDAGGAVGAALSVWHQYLGNEREARTGDSDDMQGAYLGSAFDSVEIRKLLQGVGAAFEELKLTDMIDVVAREMADGKVVGWFQGRMEFGPRALGNRSILGDPHSPAMQRQMNLKIKYRESFRPFAPAVMRERASEYFDIDSDSPYMLLVAPVGEKVRVETNGVGDGVYGLEKLDVRRSTLPAITHVDLSARVQTVTRDDNPRFYDLIRRFGEITGDPVVINTSFNVRGEPIVCTPLDAFNCFIRTEMDVLAIGNFVVHKSKQKPRTVAVDDNWKKQFPAD
jgi:carbamoyltransferase